MKFKLTIITFFAFIIFYGCERPTNLNQSDDGIPPAVPVNLQIYFAGDGEISLDWIQNYESDLKGYNIYRSLNDSSYSFLSFTTNTYFDDDSLDYNQTYYYKITAVDIYGRESSLSSKISAKPENKNPPIKIRYPYINARNWEGKIEIYLSWDRNPESDIKGYFIYRNNKNAFTADSTNLIGFTRNVFFNDTSELVFYHEYYYKIKAVDKGNITGTSSDEISDHILEIPGIVYPKDNSSVPFFEYFTIKTISSSR